MHNTSFLSHSHRVLTWSHFMFNKITRAPSRTSISTHCQQAQKRPFFFLFWPHSSVYTTAPLSKSLHTTLALKTNFNTRMIDKRREVISWVLCSAFWKQKTSIFFSSLSETLFYIFLFKDCVSKESFETKKIIHEPFLFHASFAQWRRRNFFWGFADWFIHPVQTIRDIIKDNFCHRLMSFHCVLKY